MEEECNSCMSSGFALQYGARMPALPRGCRWDCEGMTHVDCSLQKAASCIGFVLPSSSALISYEMVNIFSYITIPHSHRAKEGFRSALYHSATVFTLKMSVFPPCNSFWTKGRGNRASDPVLPPHKAVMLAQQCSDIIQAPASVLFPRLCIKSEKNNLGVYFPSCLPLLFPSAPTSHCLIHVVRSSQANRCTTAMRRRSGTRNKQQRAETLQLTLLIPGVLGNKHWF